MMKSIGILILLCSVGVILSAQELQGTKPNIILVMTDDQGYGDLKCHGHPFLQTPNIDKLHSQSTRFTDFHASPTCAPTRAALMSGRAPFKNGITHTILERERMTLKTTTIAQVLKTAGYTTGIFGKWHLGDEDAYQPHSRGFDEVFIHGGGGIGQVFTGSCADVPGNKYFDPVIRHNKTFVKTKGYCTDIFFQQALGWIKKQKDKPFFAYISTNAPHGPFVVGKKYSDLYKDKVLNTSAVAVKRKDRVASFLGMITNLDENMGRLMQKLEEWELAEKTLLVFMTDNGSSSGGSVYNYGMKGYKGSTHEGGTKVPLFMRLPGKIKAGVDVSRLTRHFDIFPTLAAFAGAKLSSNLDLDGRSLIPLIKDQQATWPHRFLFFHAGRWNKKGASGRWGKGNTDADKAKYNGFAVRSGKWRLVGKELYDIGKDPGEKKNVIKENPEVAAEMLKAFDVWWKEVRPLFVNEDETLDKEKPFHILYKKQQAKGAIPRWQQPEL